MGFFLCPWMFYQKPREKEIKNINIENYFFPCVQKFFVITEHVHVAGIKHYS